MTNLELPPISFARYLDLLKRRRWQVVPVSILGLLIGGLVAFFVPRYYVSQTVVQFRGSVLELGPGRDPMKKVVGAAQISIGYAVEDAVVQLGWPEATSGPLEDRRAFLLAVKEEVDVKDLGPREPRRTVANVRISYRDVDGERAKELCNKLRDVWIEGQASRLKQKAENELAEVNRRIGIAVETVRSLEQEKVAFERNNDVNPNDPERAVLSDLTLELRGVRALVAKAEVEEAAISGRLNRQKTLLQSMSPTKLETRTPSSVPVVNEQIKTLMQTIQVLDRALELITPNHPDYQNRLRDKRDAETMLSTLNASIGVGERVKVENPQYTKIAEQIDADEIKLATVQEELARLRRRQSRLSEERKALPKIQNTYRNLKRELAAAERQLKLFQAERSNKEAKKRELTEAEPYTVLEWARLSPRATEPNISLVALAGSAVGLALAIALILLLDIVQSTYKTADDVERQLPVPLLGGMSHMVTSEERRQVAARRTRAGLVAAAFAVLMISVVTIYYISPTRLPPVVRDTLSLILGTPASTSPVK